MRCSLTVSALSLGALLGLVSCGAASQGGSETESPYPTEVVGEDISSADSKPSGDSSNTSPDGVSTAEDQESGAEDTNPDTSHGDAQRGSEWVESSHGNVKPEAASAFPSAIREITVSITATDWDALKTQMESYCGTFGSGGQTQCEGSTSNLDFVPTEAELWVPCTVETDGQVWKHVGIRLKGNSSLTSAWGSGSYVLPFRLTMDKFEDEYPEISDQRFYGFQKISLTNNSGDASGIREMVARDFFEQAGVPVSSSSPAYLTLVIGDQTVQAGSLYTLIEVPDNPLLNRWFDGDDDGALYKPLSALKSFVLSEFEEDDILDYSDVQGVITSLNASNRLTSPAEWRATLESMFDVELFLRYLAVNTVILNWDAYGQMAHNYYLYNYNGVIQWIAWDLGLSFGSGGGGGPTPPGTQSPGGPGGGPGGNPPGGGTQSMSTTSIWYEDAGTSWPLITNLLDDPVYCNMYADIMDETITAIVTEASYDEKVAAYGALVGGYGATALDYDMAARLTTVQTSLAKRTTMCPSE